MSENHVARQLQRFAASKHPVSSAIRPQDIALTSSILGLGSEEGSESDQEPPFPPDWTSARAFRAFMREWRQKYALKKPGKQNPQKNPPTATKSAKGPPTEIPEILPSIQPSTPPRHRLPEISKGKEPPLPSTPQRENSKGKEPLLPTPLRPTRIGPLDFNFREPKTPIGDNTDTESPNHSSPLIESPAEIGRSQTPVHERDLSGLSRLSLSLHHPDPQSPIREEEEENPSPRRKDSPNPPSPPADMSQDGRNQPLTAEAAAMLMAAAFAQHKTDVNELVTRTVQQMQRDSPGPAHSPGHLKPDEVGYFNPTLKDPEGGGTVAQGKTTIYTDVFAFTDRLRHLAEVHGSEKVKSVWTTCLQATALVWHTTELTDLEKTALTGGSIELICSTLQKRFRRNHSEALRSLKSRSFTMMDLYRGRQLRPFIQTVIRDAKACDLPLLNQLLYAFEALDPEIQGQLDKPTELTTLGSFLTQVDNRESVLVNKAHQQIPALPPQQPISAFYGKQQPYSPNPPYRQQQANPYYNQSPYRGGYGRQYGNQQPWRRGQYGWNRQSGQRDWQQQQHGDQRNGNLPNDRQAPNQQAPYQYQGRGYGNRQPYQNRYQNSYQNNYRQNTPQAPQQAGGNAAPGQPPWLKKPNTPPRAYHGFDENPESESQQHGDLMTCGPIPEGFGPPDLHFETPDQPEDSYTADYHQDQYQPLTEYQDPQDPDPEHEVSNFGMVISQSAKPDICNHCNTEFASKSKLHKHLRRDHAGKRESTHESAHIAVAITPITEEVLHTDDRMRMSAIVDPPAAKQPNPEPKQQMADIFNTPESTKSGIPIIRSSVDSRPDIGTGFTYKSRTYLKFFIMTSPTSEREQEICGDTGCTRTLADKAWLRKHYPTAQIRRRATPMLIRGIGEDQHTTSEYVIIPFYFKGTRDGKPSVATFVREVTLVNGLQANMLLGTDILDAEQIDIILSRKFAIIQSCRTAIPLSVTPSPGSGKAKVLAAIDYRIPARTYQYIQVTHEAIPGQDLMFEPASNLVTSLAAITREDTRQIPIWNDTHADIRIPRHTLMGYLSPIQPDCRGYHITDDEKAINLAVRQPSRKETDKRILGETRDFVTSDTKAIKHPTGVSIYNGHSPGVTQALSKVITEFEQVFRDTGFASVPEDEEARVQLKPEWEKQVPKRCRAYPLNAEDRGLVHDTIAKLESQGRVVRTKYQVPFSFPVFVVWRMMPDGKRKGRMVVDIRNLNSMALSDAYPMKSQDDMLAKIAGSTFITVCDAVLFYYQWRAHPSSRWCLTITTLDGQYTFNCLIMGYKNSNAHVQRQMDVILEGLESADCYCDDIVLASKTFEDHIGDLRILLALLLEKNISLGPSKSFIAFPNAVVLGRMANSFGLSTTRERLEAIAKILFPLTLKDLETFIGMAGYMRSNVPRYAEIAEPLEQRKAALIRQHPRRGAASKQGRKKWSATVPIDTPTETERLSFEAIKTCLTQYTTLAFFEASRILGIDFDVSRRGIGVTVYHIADEALPKITNEAGQLTTFPPRTAVHPIAFLSRVLTTAEKKYWPTEMEVLGFVWTLQKTRHWIDVCQKGVFVFTDHRAIVGMSKHKDIVNSTALSNKNLRLIRAMEFISRFDVTILHKAGKLHIVPDALSRLPADPAESESPGAEGGLDCLPDEADEHFDTALHLQGHEYAFIDEVLPAIRMAAARNDPTDPLSSKDVHLMQISPEFHRQLIKGYNTDPRWSGIISTLKNNAAQGVNGAHLPFHLRNGLLWKSSDTFDRLCIPRACHPEIFEILHGSNHASADQMDLLSFVIDRKELRRFLKSCPECAVMKTRTHKPYGSLQPIIGPPCPFHTLTIDIAFGLPESHGHNAFLAAVCKMTKALQIIPGRHDWTAENWANSLVDRLLTIGWGFPKVILSDRDPKFLSQFWSQVWKRMGARLLYSTSYHPITDGQTERLILRIKSTLRYYFHALEDPTEWLNAVPRLQYEINTARASATGLSPAEAITGFTPNPLLDVIPQQDGIDRKPALKAPLARIQIHDAIAASAMSAKKYYDMKHQPLFFNINDKVLLRLHKGYNIPQAASLGRKLGQQYAGPFTVTERIGRSAYRLQFPSHYRIHDVVSVDHLEPAPPLDVFGRQLPLPGPIHVEAYGKRIVETRKDRYLVEFIGLGREYDKWMTRKELGEDGETLIANYQMKKDAKAVRFA